MKPTRHMARARRCRLSFGAAMLCGALSACAGDGRSAPAVSAPPPTTSVTVGATASTVPTRRDMPDGTAPIEPGTYLIPSSPWSLTDFTVTMPDGWQVQYGHVYSKHENEDTEFGFYAVVVDEIYTDACLGPEGVPTGVGPTGADLVAALTAQPGAEMDSPIDTTLGGFPATRLDLRIPEGLDLAACRLGDAGLQVWYSRPVDKYFVLLPGAEASVYIVEVAGGRQVFLTQHRADTSEADLAELQAVLDSIRIAPEARATDPVQAAPQSSFTTPWPSSDTVTWMHLVEQAVTPSSIGDLRWTVLESESADDPRAEWWVRGPRGFMTVRAGRLMASEDALSWRPVAAPLPGRPRFVWQGRDGFDLILRGPDGETQVWRSPDLETWTRLQHPSGVGAFAGRIDGPDLLTGFVWAASPEVSMDSGSFAVANVSVGLDLRGRIAARIAGDRFFEALEDGRGAEIWWEPSGPDGLSGVAGVAVLRSHSWGAWDDAKAGSPAAFEVEMTIAGAPDGWAVDVRNAATGESFGRVQGSISAGDLAGTLQALVNEQFHEWIVIEGDTAEPVHPEWAGAGEPDWSLTFATVDDRLFVYLPGTGPGPPDIWRTADGRTWEHLGAAAGWPELAPSWAQGTMIYQAPGGALLGVMYGGRGEGAMLTSTDGVNWRAAAQPPAFRPADQGSGFESRIAVTREGFVVLAFPWGDEDFVEVWTSPDGDIWTPVEADRLVFDHATGNPGEDGIGSGSTLDLTTLTYRQSGRPTIAWLIEVT